MDREGIVRVGWVADNVFFAHFRGNLNPKLAERYARAVATRVALRQDGQIFCDLRGIENTRALYDVLGPLQALPEKPRFVRLLVPSPFAGFAATSLSLLHRMPLQQTRDRKLFRMWLKAATANENCDFDSVRGIPIERSAAETSPPRRL